MIIQPIKGAAYVLQPKKYQPPETKKDKGKREEEEKEVVPKTDGVDIFA